MRVLRALVAVCAAVAVMVPGGPARAAADVTFTNWDVGVGQDGGPVRVEISWWAVQGEPAWPYDWGRSDATIDAAVAKRQKILLLITYAPPWSNGHSSDKWFPLPAYDSGWAAFVDATVRRYADRVRAYEIWNEPNLLAFGNYGGNTEQERKQRYWDLVRLSHATITAACASCLVLAGGSAEGSAGNSPAGWLDWAYRNGYGHDFEAVATHPYPAWSRKEGPVPATDYCGRPDLALFGADYRPGKPYQQQCGQLGALRAVLVDNGDPGKKIWGTEWGYPTASWMGASHASLERIRDYDVEGVHVWRERSYLGPLFLYAYQDACTDPVDPECHYGIVDVNGVPKEPLFPDLRAKVADTVPDLLLPGQSLRRLQALRSPGGRFTLWMQGDGNLVLYDGGKAIWVASGKGRRLVNQNDGNLVLYANPEEPVAVWATGTDHTPAGTFYVQNDGNLVRYAPDGTPVWASHTEVPGAV